MKLSKSRQQLIILGLGSVGQTLFELCNSRNLFEKYILIDEHEKCSDFFSDENVLFIQKRIESGNIESILNELERAPSILVNLTGQTDTLDVVKLCQEKGWAYLDSAISLWPEKVKGKTLVEKMLWRTHRAVEEYVEKNLQSSSPTVLVNHGANPGLVNHFVKRALCSIAKDKSIDMPAKLSRADWVDLAIRLGLKAIQISERDQQFAPIQPSNGDFYSTWSPFGLWDEGHLLAEWAWGSSERSSPHSKIAFIEKPGFCVKTHQWTPSGGPSTGFLIQHSECESIADYFTLQSSAQAPYRPTVHYSYHPCELTIQCLENTKGAQWRSLRGRLLQGDHVGGFNELGVLLMGDFGARWYGVRTSVDFSRKQSKLANCTTLQVASGLVSGLHWISENMNCGFKNPDDLPFQSILDHSLPFLGEVLDCEVLWRPNRSGSSEDWSFSNFLLDDPHNIQFV